MTTFQKFIHDWRLRNMQTVLTLPTIHLNGTSADDLLEQQCNAASAIREAITAVANAGPNGRDYYPQGPQAFTLATEQHRARLQKLQDVLTELEQLAEYIADEQMKRERR